MKKYPKIKLRTHATWFDAQCFCEGDVAWAVETLWEAAKDLPIYDVPLVGMNIDIAPWDGVGRSFTDFLSHVKLINEADMSYPIILTPSGAVADGRHRLGKAIVEGLTHVKIKRLEYMPEPDYAFDEDGDSISFTITSEEE